MRFKMGFAAGFGAGYVLGAKAGRARYEQIKKWWDQLSGSSPVQWAAGRTKDVAGQSARRGLTVMKQGVHKAGSAARDRLNRGDGKAG